MSDKLSRYEAFIREVAYQTESPVLAVYARDVLAIKPTPYTDEMFDNVIRWQGYNSVENHCDSQLRQHLTALVIEYGDLPLRTMQKRLNASDFEPRGGLG